MEKSTVFFNSYNNALKAAYNNCSEENRKDLQQYLGKAINSWKQTCIAGLDGKTPEGYIDSITNFKDMAELFRKGAVLCDDKLPDIFLEKLHSYSEEAIDELIMLCQNTELMQSCEDDFLIPVAAAELLGDWKVEKAVVQLIAMLEDNGINNEMICEKARESIVKIGTAAIDAVLLALETNGFECAAAEYLLMALSDIGVNNQSEKIYKCLKSGFLKANKKAISAICLGNYGDGRAIPVLRGFLEKNRNCLDKEAFYGIVSAIKHLGGNTEDLEGRVML